MSHFGRSLRLSGYMTIVMGLNFTLPAQGSLTKALLISCFLLLSNFQLRASTHRAAACGVVSDFSSSVSGQTVTFTNLTTGANKYQWSFGDGTTSSQPNPVHMYPSSNSYTVVLYAYDSTISGCFDSTAYIIKADPGSCHVEADFKYTVSGTTLSFENYSVNYGTMASKNIWYFGDGYSSNQATPVHTYASAGSYTLTYIFRDTSNTNCDDTIVHQVNFSACNASTDFTYIFTGPLDIKVTNTSTNCTDYSIPFDSNGEYTYHFPYPGIHKFGFFGWNKWCGYNKADSTEKTINVPGCHAYARFYTSKDTNNIFSGIISDYSTYRPRAYYMWFFGDGDSSSSTTPTHVYPGPGVYNLCLVIRDSICHDMYCDTIEFDSSGHMRAAFSIKVVDMVTSVKDTKKDMAQAVKVYPNPGTGIYRIASENGDLAEIKVLDLQGKIVLDRTVNDKEASIDISAFSKGIYLFMIRGRDGRSNMIKVIKNE